MQLKAIKNTNIAVKLGFTSMLVLVIIFGVISLYPLRGITLDMTNTIGINSQKIVHVSRMRDAIRQRQIVMSAMLSMEDIFERDNQRIRFYYLSGIYRVEREKLINLPISSGENKLLIKIREHTVFAQPLNRDAVDFLIDDYHSVESRELINQAQNAQSKLLDLLDDLVIMQNQNTQNFVKISQEKYQRTLFWSVLVGIVVALLAWLIARVMTQFVSQKNEELVSKNKELENISEQALEATRIKSEFLAVMSHEIRTPLTSVIGFSEALAENSVQPEERIRLAQTILKNGKHLLKIINDILDISKIEANRMGFESTSFSPVEIVSDVEDIIKTQFMEKGIQFYVEYDFPLPNVICNDALRIKQIILNLCSNALKFTKTGKVCIKIHCDIDNEKIYFTVIDSGIGLTRDQIDKIFDAFTQADSSTTREYGGTGLGLSLSKQFAEKMGGTITVESLLGLGSQFCVSISTGKIDPQQLIVGEPELPEKTESVKLQHDYSYRVKGSLLIVEDNYDNRQLLSVFLSKIGADITFAEDGLEAIGKALSKTYDLIFMDMQMPVMGGLEATKKLRQANYTNPIIALTANAMKSDYDKCIEAGCDDFLTKPINKKEIFQSIYKYLEIEDVKVDEEKNVFNLFEKRGLKMRELVKKFVKELPVKIDKIEHFRNENNWKGMKDELHQIKGIAASMGYPVVTDIAAELEFEVMRENEVEINRLLLKIKTYVNKLTKEFSDLTSKHKG